MPVIPVVTKFLISSGLKVACLGFCRGGVGRVDKTACFEPLDDVLMDGPAPPLPVGFVWSADPYALTPVHTQPLHGMKQLLVGLFGIAFGVGIFHAEYHFAAGMAGPAPVE